MILIRALVNDWKLWDGCARAFQEHSPRAFGEKPTIHMRALAGATTIAAGYNKLADGGKDCIYCFVHQDARLMFDISTIIPRYFELLSRPGIVGFCGTKEQVVGKQWWDCDHAKRYGGLIQNDNRLTFNPCTRGEALKYEPVQTLDGFCLFVKHECLKAIGGFDEGYDDWHGYDIDICMKALAAGYQNYVIDQPAQHLSWGGSGPGLDRALARFKEKWTPRPTEKKEEKKGMKICVYTIAKNEIKHVDRFMASCKGADGVYVLDTGSTDGTPERLRELGATVKVVQFAPWKTVEEYYALEKENKNPWRFDLARNMNLEMVPEDADVCVCVDLDEILVPGWRQVVERAWVPGTLHMQYQYSWSMRNPWPDGVAYDQAHDFIRSNEPVQRFPYHKIHARKGYGWVRPVHEVDVAIDGTQEFNHWAGVNDILVQHYPDGSKPRSSYLEMLRLGVEEDANETSMKFYYGRELSFVQRWADCITQLTNFMNMPDSKCDFERSSAAQILGIAHRELSKLAPDGPERFRLNQQAIGWFMAACKEMPGQRDPWVEFGKHCYETGDWPGCYWASSKALAIPVGDWRHNYTSSTEAWGGKANELACISSYRLGLKDESLRHAWTALELEPFNDHFVSNCAVTQDCTVAEPKPTGKALVDVVILAYSKTHVEYDMACRGIKSLRRSSPDVPMNIVVVETNSNLPNEQFGVAPLFGGGVEVVYPNPPFGYNAYLHEGFAKLSGAKYLMILNNDVVLFSQGFLRDMMRGLDTVQSVSPLGLREANWGKINRAAPLDIGFDVNRQLEGWCVMFDTAILQCVSLETLFPKGHAWYGQDITYGEELKKRAYKHGLVTAAKALHLQQKSRLLLGNETPPADRVAMLTALNLKGKRCAEIGVARGDFAAHILACQPAGLWLVDPWRQQLESVYPQDGCNLVPAAFEDEYQGVLKRFAGQEEVVHIERDFSKAVAARMADGFLDMVYIDAIHTRDAALENMREWLSKIKKGGVMCGHDYQTAGVADAVREFLLEHSDLRLAFVTTEPVCSWAIRV